MNMPPPAAADGSASASDFKKPCIGFPLWIVLETESDRERLEFAQCFVNQLHYTVRIVRPLPLPFAHPVASHDYSEKSFFRTLESWRQQILKLGHAVSISLRCMPWSLDGSYFQHIADSAETPLSWQIMVHGCEFEKSAASRCLHSSPCTKCLRKPCISHFRCIY